MSRRNKNHYKKSNAEKIAYEKRIRSYQSSQEMDTVQNISKDLLGSDQDVNENTLISHQIPVRGKSIKYKILDWVKGKLPEIVISAFLIPIAFLVGQNLFDLNKEIGIVDFRLESLEESIEENDNESVSKEFLQLYIESLKEDFENNRILEVYKINNRLDAIEEAIDKLK